MGRPRYYRSLSFHGGQNDTVSEIHVAAHEASRARNVDLDRDGAFSKRKGATVQNGAGLGAGVKFGMLHQFLPSGGTEKLFASYADKISTFAGASFTELLTGLSADQRILNADFRNLMYLMGESGLPMLYHQGGGSPSIFRPGAPQPSSSLSDGGAVAGSIASNGQVLVRVRYVNIIDDTFFGDPDPPAGFAVTIDNSPTGGRTINNIPTGPEMATTVAPVDYRIAKRIIERTTVGGGTFYRDGIINDNTTTTYNITRSDADLLEDDLMPAPGLRLPMPRLYPLITHQNRIVGYDPTDFGKIVWSEIDEFGIVSDFFPEAHFLYLNLQDGYDEPKAVAPMGEYLVWWCGRSIHLMYIAEDGSAYSRRMAGHKLNVPSPRGVVELPFGQLAWTSKGPYFLAGNQLIFAGERIEKTLADIPKSTLDRMFTMHRTQEQRRQVIFVLPEAGGARNNLAAKYHYRRIALSNEGFPTQHAWTFDDGFESSIGEVTLNAQGVEVEYQADYDGKLYRTDLGDSDDRGVIAGEYVTGWDDFQSPEGVKFFEEIWVFLSGEGSSQITVAWETRLGKGVSGSHGMQLTTELSKWDVLKWDEDPWASEASIIQHAHLGNDGINARGKYIRFRFSNSNANEPFTVVGFIVKYAFDSDREDRADAAA